MVVTSDLGDSLNIHPIRKMEVGKRFALQALNKVYGYNVTADGPIPFGSRHRGDKVVVTFRNGCLRTTDGEALRELEIKKSDGVFYHVKGTIRKNKIIINHCSDATAIRYAWVPFSRGNLINKSGIPASVFELNFKQ